MRLLPAILSLLVLLAHGSCATVNPTGEDDEPWLISALTAPAGDAGLEEDLGKIAAFNERHAAGGAAGGAAAGAAAIDMIELKADSSSAIDHTLDRIPDELFVFFELPAASDPRGMIAALVGGEAGAKIRTGGVTAEAYPSPAQVARFITACASADVPFKATAGMRHPLRRHSAAAGVREFGFVNMLIAAALAQHVDMGEALLVEVLEAETLEPFRFEADSLSWRGHRLETAQVEDTRLGLAISFASCSFDEPLDGLRAIGLL